MSISDNGCEECLTTDSHNYMDKTPDGNRVIARLRFDVENRQLDVIAQVEYSGGEHITEHSVTINYCPFCGRDLRETK